MPDIYTELVDLQDQECKTKQDGYQQPVPELGHIPRCMA